MTPCYNHCQSLSSHAPAMQPDTMRPPLFTTSNKKAWFYFPATTDHLDNLFYIPVAVAPQTTFLECIGRGVFNKAVRWRHFLEAKIKNNNNLKKKSSP